MNKQYEIDAGAAVEDVFIRLIKGTEKARARGWVLKYGSVIGAAICAAWYYLGNIGLAVGCVLIWIIGQLWLMYIEIGGNVKRRLIGNLALKIDRVCVGNDGVHLWRAPGDGLRLSYLFSCLECVRTDAGELLFLKGRQRGRVIFGSEIILRPNGQMCGPGEEIRERKCLNTRADAQKIVPGVCCYKGARFPMFVERFVPIFSPQLLLMCFLSIILSAACVAILGTSAASIDRLVFLFSASPVLYLLNMSMAVQVPDNEKVTIHYSLRKRAVVARSSDGWVAVIPYSLIETCYRGGTVAMLKTRDEVLFPCPPDILTHLNGKVPTGRYRTGLWLWLVLSIPCWILVSTAYVLLEYLLMALGILSQ